MQPSCARIGTGLRRNKTLNLFSPVIHCSWGERRALLANSLIPGASCFLTITSCRARAAIRTRASRRWRRGTVGWWRRRRGTVGWWRRRWRRRTSIDCRGDVLFVPSMRAEIGRPLVHLVSNFRGRCSTVTYGNSGNPGSI